MSYIYISYTSYHIIPYLGFPFVDFDGSTDDPQVLEEFQLAYDKFGRYGGCRRGDVRKPKKSPSRTERGSR